MKSFAERNPVTIAVVGLITLTLVGFGAFNAKSLPLIGGGTEYTADFTDAAGLRTGDDVSVAGVEVGTVDSIDLAGDRVRVTFTVKDTWVGDATTAAVKIKSVLGQEYIALDPLGDHEQNADSTIPLRRTTTPTTVSDALNGLTRTVGSIDTEQLAKSFEVLATTFADTPKSVRAAVGGLSSLSTVLAARDTQLRQLAANTAALTTTLADNNKQFDTLIKDGALLLAELQARSTAITQLLRDSERFAQQVSGLVRDNKNDLGPALAQLHKVGAVLDANQGSLDEAARLIGPYYSLVNDAAGSGHWLDVYLCGLFDSTGAPQLNSTALRNCNPGQGG